MPHPTGPLPDATDHPRRHSALLRLGLWASPLLLLLTLFGWGLSSPPGSSPDDVFHVASIWCAHGERQGLCEETNSPNERLVPSAIVDMACFAFRPEVDASCQNGLPERTDIGLAMVNHGNWNGNIYPPVFYATFGIFASENVAWSVAVIRLVNALIVTAALSATMLLLPRHLRPVLGLSTALTLVPLGLFVLPSTNPSSWGLLSAAVVFPAFLGLADTQGKRRSGLLVMVAFGVVLGAGARADAAVYAAFAAALAWFVSYRRSRFTTLTLTSVLLVTAVSFFTAGQSEAISGLRSGSEDSSSPGITLVLQNLVQLPALWLGMFTNLGWLDTSISPLALFGVVFSVMGVLFSSLETLNWKKGAALAIILLAFTLLPLYMLNASNASIGSQVQPRYILPLFVVLVAVAVTPAPRTPYFTALQLATLALLLAGAQAVALQDQLTRYVSGEGLLNLSNGGWWWGGLTIAPLGLLAITALSFAILIGLLAWAMNGYQESPSSPDCSADPAPFNPAVNSSQ